MFGVQDLAVPFVCFKTTFYQTYMYVKTTISQNACTKL